jgi:hypothetical protein
MRARSDVTKTGGLEVQVVYSIGALARAGNVTRDAMQRLLAAHGVEFVRVGRSLLVPLCEIEEKVPPIWRSLVAAEAARGD